MMLRWPDVREWTFKLHPFEHGPRHGKISWFVKSVTIIQRTIIIEVLRRDGHGSGQEPSFVRSGRSGREIFNPSAELEFLRVVRVVV